MKRLLSSICRKDTERSTSTYGGPRDTGLGRLMIFVQSGDKQSYAQLLGDCTSLLRAGAFRHGIEGDLAALFIQNTLVTMHHARHTYDPSRSFEDWLDAISQHVASDLRRSGRRPTKQGLSGPLAFEPQ